MITQGDAGVKALDRVVRGFLQLQPGAELKLCVDYRLLRLNVLQQGITGSFRVFLFDQMTLYIKPCDGDQDIIGVQACGRDGKMHSSVPCSPIGARDEFRASSRCSGCVGGGGYIRVSVYQNIISPSVKRANDHNEVEGGTKHSKRSSQNHQVD